MVMMMVIKVVVVMLSVFMVLGDEIERCLCFSGAAADADIEGSDDAQEGMITILMM